MLSMLRRRPWKGRCGTGRGKGVDRLLTSLTLFLAVDLEEEEEEEEEETDEERWRKGWAEGERPGGERSEEQEFVPPEAPGRFRFVRRETGCDAAPLKGLLPRACLLPLERLGVIGVLTTAPPFSRREAAALLAAPPSRNLLLEERKAGLESLLFSVLGRSRVNDWGLRSSMVEPFKIFVVRVSWVDPGSIWFFIWKVERRWETRQRDRKFGFAGERSPGRNRGLQNILWEREDFCARWRIRTRDRVREREREGEGEREQILGDWRP